MHCRFALFVFLGLVLPATGAPKEQDYYKIITLPVPQDVVLEVGGLEWLDEDRTQLVACNRRGEVWLVENAYKDNPLGFDDPLAGSEPERVVRFQRMLFGLHEPLGLLRRPEGMYVAQRGELTLLKDLDGDKRFDALETVCNDWQISGNYHEYAFGPKLDKDGQLWITLNRPFGGGQEGQAYWRGWAMRIDPKTGKMQPVCPGLRSPAGLGTNVAGDMFYTDNQGEWVAVCKLSHLQKGRFYGSAISLESCNLPGSTMKDPGSGFPISGLRWPEAAAKMPQLEVPAVWFPYPIMGKSHSDILVDNTGGKFGPFGKQLFIGDQGNAIIVRVALEKVNGHYQGACFPFRSGFQSGVLRMTWGHDGSMFVGGTNRGWGGGPKPFCLERLVWSGKTPFEIHSIHARPDGFELTFTKPIDRETAKDPKAYALRAWTYRYHSNYGDSPQDTHPLEVRQVTLGDDGKSVRLFIDNCKAYYVHEIRPNDVRSVNGEELLHPIGYYTLNYIPGEDQ